MDKESIQHKIEELEKQNIEFVHKYSFWGIFRTSKDFKLYNNDQQLLVCKKIRKPMLIASIICPLIIIIFLILAIKSSKIFVFFTFLISIYYFIYLYLMIGYTKLIHSLE